MAKRGGKSKVKAKKVVKAAKKPKVSKKVIKEPAKPMEPPAEEVRVLKKLPPSKAKDAGRQVMRVFGHEISPNKIKSAAMEAYSKRTYTIDDIQVDHYIREHEWDNVMTKIGILDRIEEQLNLMYPHIDVVRKNKITLELYLKE